jgi:hypothetical protein
MSTLKAAIEHEIEVTNLYSPILRAAGIDPSNLTSIQIFELSGYITNDAEVERRYFEEEPRDLATRMALLGSGLQHKLLLRAIEGMDQVSKRKMAERCANRMKL